MSIAQPYYGYLTWRLVEFSVFYSLKHGHTRAIVVSNIYIPFTLSAAHEVHRLFVLDVALSEVAEDFSHRIFPPVSFSTGGNGILVAPIFFIRPHCINMDPIIH
ncbi:hypothetical protein HAX54_048652 [Datura stramonium]|uniref:Uncharacterized protein n=1 Tax=Datura stramonium TaxID=4076 RepID=A0ABS8WJJ5_DATST|nr:hypothetical protein [Datura stramonium]